MRNIPEVSLYGQLTASHDMKDLMNLKSTSGMSVKFRTGT